MFAPKQKNVLREANHRWNVLYGATRGGKSYISLFLIPKRIAKFGIGKHPMLLSAYSLSKIEDNILNPMRELYGKEIVEFIKKDNNNSSSVKIFGQKFKCVGHGDAGKKNAIHGSEYAYAYVDEAGLMDESFFTMLKSRLSIKGAMGDLTMNPTGKDHFMYKFLQQGVSRGGMIDIGEFKFTIDDNPFLDPEYVTSLKNEYAGSIFYDRYILGNFVNAQGIIYEVFAKDNARHIIDMPKPNEIIDSIIGIDFGEAGSHIAMQHIGILKGLKGIVVLDELYVDGHRDIELLKEQAYRFVKKQQDMGFSITKCRYDLAQGTLGETIGANFIKKGLPINTEMCVKHKINDRIHFVLKLFSMGMFKICKHCTVTIDAFNSAVWNEKVKDKDERLDNGTSNIDTLDATEYAFEPYMETFQILTGF